MFKILIQLCLLLLVSALSVVTGNAGINNQFSKSSMVNTVSLPAIADNLRKANILTETDYQQVLRLINNGTLNSRSQLLSKLEENLARSNISSHERELSTVLVQIERVVSDKEKIHLQLQKLLQKLQGSGILSDRAYKQLLADILADRIQLDVALYRDAAMQMRVYEELQPSRVEPELNSLRQVDIISQANSTKLLQALRTENISDRFEFFNYFNRAVVFDLRDYKTNSQRSYVQIHRAIAQMLVQTGIADIAIDNFSLKTGLELDDEDRNAVVSVWVNGKQYQQGCYSSNPQDKNDFLACFDTDNSIELFNKVLRDRSSPYRIYAESATYKYSLDNSRFAVYALTDDQARVYFRRDDFTTDKTYSSDRIKYILKLFNQIGLLNHLTKEQISAGEQRIRQRYITDSYQLLEAFPNLVVTFDWESAEGDNPYAELTEEFAAASKGSFIPTQVSDNFDLSKETVEHSFILGERRYLTKLKIKGDWLDPDYFPFITQIVADTATTGKFYPLYYSDSLFSDSDAYIFLTKEQHQVLQSEGLILTKPPN